MILVSDYDDTFYTNEIDVIKNVSAVNEFMKNNIFVIATGRSYFDFLKKQELYNIKYNYLIINYGATIIKNNKVIYNNFIDNDIKEDLIIDLKKENILDSFCCSELESRLNFYEKNLTKIYVKYENAEITKKIYDSILNKYSNYINAFLVSKNQAIEIVSKDVNKSNSIKFLSTKENIDYKNIYTIGNGYSDIEMIKDFNGFAITDSIDELKKYSIKQYDNLYNLINDIISKKFSKKE